MGVCIPSDYLCFIIELESKVVKKHKDGGEGFRH